MKHPSTLLLALALTACATGHHTAQPSIDGEWAVKAIDGKAVTGSEGFEPAFLGFSGSQLHGSTSCNQLTGSLLLNASKGSISFAQTGCTRMLCHDDAVERALLAALPRAKTYTVSGDTLTLSTQQGQAVMVLVKK